MHFIISYLTIYRTRWSSTANCRSICLSQKSVFS